MYCTPLHTIQAEIVRIHELHDAGIRINQQKPDITIKKTASGGIRVSSVGEIGLDEEEN
jgi:ribosome-interacting GTPase 1